MAQFFSRQIEDPITAILQLELFILEIQKNIPYFLTIGDNR